ncbi:FAD-dependent oxidoreductase [Desulfatitalea alkaliphila]|uniref:FAD-dependent oxidoreductase n=1 Tax=Desulfatitalea alkaliphila TaxID=2929485 RepID=A0AA41R452_9BACT|nr:FAD-dependent oxidoreductase [Desulfatitalea alkaliphila]MCJ8502029.1 FAD-dependent oxidoreductase [Desulfatitalea alkaliphila]
MRINVAFMKEESSGRPDQVEEVIRESTGSLQLPPCQLACPVGEDIQRTNVMLSQLSSDPKRASWEILNVGDAIYNKNPMFMICGYICGICESQCTYKEHTGAVKRTLLKRFVTEHYMPYLDIKKPLPAPKKQKVAIIGGGPSGLTAAYKLATKGYRVSLFERSSKLGGGIRYIPTYRLPARVLDSTVNNLVRIANTDVHYNVEFGADITLESLKEDGFEAIFAATGTPMLRNITFGGQELVGTAMRYVMYGLPLLYEANYGVISANWLAGKRALVIGGGNVAFDVARMARRLGGDVTVICLENEDKSSKDGIPADQVEIDDALEEGVKILYSRGVQKILGEHGRFTGIRAPKCTSVFNEEGRFQPQFDMNDVQNIKADALFIAVGQSPERFVYEHENLLNDQGQLDVDPVTRMSKQMPGVFLGGDVTRIGLAAEAMRDGLIAAESINRYLNNEDLKQGRQKEVERCTGPEVHAFRPAPMVEKVSPEERMNFDIVEKGFTLAEAVAEARRCLYCGPCKSCKACVALGYQEQIPNIEVDAYKCSGCGVCISVCCFNARRLEKHGEDMVAVVDTSVCKRCGLCVGACPSNAITIYDNTDNQLEHLYASLSAGAKQ